MPDQPPSSRDPSSAAPTSRLRKPDPSPVAAVAQNSEASHVALGFPRGCDTCTVVSAILQTFGGTEDPKVVELGTDEKCSHHDVLSGSDAAFSVLQCADVRTMADDLKVAVVGALRTLQMLRPGDGKWSVLAERLYQNPIVYSKSEHDVCRVETFGSLVPVKGRGSTQKDEADPVIKEFQAWFTQLIADPATQAGQQRIGLDVASLIVAHAYRLVDRGVPSAQDNREAKLLNLAVLRYPLPDDLTIKLYHVELWVWSESKFPLDHKSRTCRFSGQFTLKSFQPRPEIVTVLSEWIKEYATSRAIAMFSR